MPLPSQYSQPHQIPFGKLPSPAHKFGMCRVGIVPEAGVWGRNCPIMDGDVSPWGEIQQHTKPYSRHYSQLSQKLKTNSFYLTILKYNNNNKQKKNK